MAAQAGSFSFSGKVINSKGHPLENVQVQLGNRYDATDSKGRFYFSNVKRGTYQLSVHSIGYKLYQKKIDVAEEPLPPFTITLQSKRYAFETVVVTATRSSRKLEEVPVPATVIDEKEINNTGAARLSDILAEQTGLRLSADHGTGVQIQGFSSEYTLIMVNGSPLIGRTAGTLDLSRISVGNIKQIEIIKGPSSALWGNNALAGVINIITKSAQKPFSAQVTSKYKTHNTIDLGADLSWKYQSWKSSFFFNRNSSSGYRLNPLSISQTVPEYYNYTASYRTQLPLSESVDFEFYSRYFRETQHGPSYTGEASSPILLNDRSLQEDYSLNPSLGFRMKNGMKFNLSHYSSAYNSERNLIFQENNELYQREVFDQTFNKTETQAILPWSSKHLTTAGMGLSRENLQSDRYGDVPVFQNIFGYLQHEWFASDAFDLIAGFRFDAHNEYGSQLSPKLSARYKISNKFHVRASAGTGFKAPDFRQLYLNFTNPTVGYSVFGSKNVVEKLATLQDEGKISRILIPTDQLKSIQAEKSLAINGGFDFYLNNELELRINFFRNNVRHMIETAPVALKTNGQSIYSYFNLNKIFTQGAEAKLEWRPLEAFSVSAGYQFLDAKRRIERTKTVQDDEGNPVSKQFTFYRPMFNRSKHSGTLKLFYNYQPLGLQANLRGTFKGPYGRIDANGNGYVDSNEYEDGYMIWDTAISKTFAERYKLQAGIENIFGFTRPQSLPYLSGRLFYLQVSLQLF